MIQRATMALPPFYMMELHRVAGGWGGGDDSNKEEDLTFF